MKLRLILLVILCCSLKSCKGGGDKIDEDKSTYSTKFKKVIVRTIKSDTVFNKQMIANGRIYCFQKSKLNFQVSNRLDEIYFRNGQIVRKGQLIASLENNLLKNSIEKFEISLKKVKNKLAEEKINYSDSLLSPEILFNLELKSGLLEAENKLERARLEYMQTFLKAPFSGIIANIEAEKRDFISYSEIFCTLINPNILEVVFYVIESEFYFLEYGKEIIIQDFHNKNKKYKGVICEINPLVNENGLIKIKAKIIDKNTGFIDGMNVKIFLNKKITDVIVIPKEALVLRSNKEVVFTVENNIVKWNYVEVINENSNSYAVKKGIKTTDTIIVSGNLNLSHAARVNITFEADNLIKR